MKAPLVAWRLTHGLVGSAILLAIAWALSGGLRDPVERLFVGAFALMILGGAFTLDAELTRERLRPGPGGLDRRMPLFARLLAAGALALGLLDGGRFSWSPPMPLVLRLTGVALFAISMAWVMWAIAVNRFWSPVVRIQAERGHHVVTTGPYRYMRHPGYAAILIGFPAAALALGSWWGLVPAGLFALLVLRRVVLEDGYLDEHLEGYRAYAGMVRYRLVPGLW